MPARVLDERFAPAPERHGHVRIREVRPVAVDRAPDAPHRHAGRLRDDPGHARHDGRPRASDGAQNRLGRLIAERVQARRERLDAVDFDLGRGHLQHHGDEELRIGRVEAMHAPDLVVMRRARR